MSNIENKSKKHCLKNNRLDHHSFVVSLAVRKLRSSLFCNNSDSKSVYLDFVTPDFFLVSHEPMLKRRCKNDIGAKTMAMYCQKNVILLSR